MEGQLDPSLSVTVPNAEKDTEEVQSLVDDTSNIKDEPIPKPDVVQHIDAADTVGPLEDASTKESQITVHLEPDVDVVAPVEEEPSTISQITAEDLLPKIESENAAISQTPLETTITPEDTTASVANVEDQIIVPVDVRSDHAAVVVESGIEAETHASGTDAATATNELVAAESLETEQPIVPKTEVLSFHSCGNVLADPILFVKGDSSKHVNEAAIVGLATVEGFSSEATPEAGNDSVESEPQLEHEYDVTTAPETEDTLPDIHSSPGNDPTPVPLPLDPEGGPIEKGLVAERQVETTSLATTNRVPIDVEDQPHPSLIETEPPNAQKDIEEVQTQIDDTSDTKDEPISESDFAQHIEAADTALEGPFEDVLASSRKESKISVQLEPEVDSVLPVEEEPSAITQTSAEDLLPKIESEGAISQTPVETISSPEDTTVPIVNAEDQIIAPVDVRSEHAPVVAHEVESEMEAETHRTDAATATNDLAAAESPETEQPIMPKTKVFIFYSCGNVLAELVLSLKGDSTKHLNEAAIVAVGLATEEGLSSIEKVVPEVHEATPEAGNDSVEIGTTLKVEREADVTTGPETLDTLPDVHSSLCNDPSPVPQPLEPESSLIKTELVAEGQVETASSATTNGVPIDVEDQRDPSSSETAPNVQKDIEEVHSQVDDTSNIKDEPIAEFSPKDKASTLEVEEERHMLLSPKNPEAANVELNDDSIPIAVAEPRSEVVTAVVAPVLGTFELQAQHSVEETTEVNFTPIAGSLVDCNKIIKEDHIVKPTSETEFIVPNEGWLRSAEEALPTNSQLESTTVDPVKTQLEIPEAGESDRTAEVEPHILPAVMEESPAEIKEDRPVLAAPQVRQLLLSYHLYLLTVNP